MDKYELEPPRERQHRIQKPPRNRKPPTFIKVLVFDLATDTQIRNHTKRLNKEGTRDWLIALMMWAVTNGKSVEVLNVSDDRKYLA